MHQDAVDTTGTTSLHVKSLVYGPHEADVAARLSQMMILSACR